VLSSPPDGSELRRDGHVRNIPPDGTGYDAPIFDWDGAPVSRQICFDALATST
jgi:hypothetical protein